LKANIPGSLLVDSIMASIFQLSPFTFQLRHG